MWRTKAALAFAALFFSPLSVAQQSPPFLAMEKIGPVYEIVEPSLLKEILDKLQQLEGSGELAALQKKMQDDAKRTIERPAGVLLPRAEKYEFHLFDPSITLDEDMYLPDGRLLHKAGTRLNPLNVARLSKRYIFIDGDDPEQVEFAHDLYRDSGWRDRVVLVKGSLKDIYAKWNRPVYFDQLGIAGQGKTTLVNTFGVKSLPSVVSQQGLYLKVESIVIR